MRILFWYCDHFDWTPAIKTLADAPKAGPAETSSEKRVRGKQKNSKKQAEKKEEIKRLLEESGTESSWIMKYLFEDQQNEIDSEKPW